MAVYFITRHQGAAEWARQQGIEAQHLTHLDLAIIHPGDWVLGTVPVNIAAEICARGARYSHLSLDLPEELRGHELTVEQMGACGARLTPYIVTKGI